MDNNVSKLDILGHYGTFWETPEEALMGSEHLDRFLSHFRPFSPICKNALQNHGLTDGRTDPLILRLDPEPKQASPRQ